MKVTLLDENATVYSDMELHTPLQTGLSAGQEFVLGNSGTKQGVEWVEVTLADGKKGYISGATNIFEIQKVVLGQEKTEVFENPSAESPVKHQYIKGNQFYLTSLVKANEGEWIKIRDDHGRNGFIKKDVQTNVIQELSFEDMKKDLRSWSVGLILIGVISIVLPEVFDPIWGIILVIIGAMALVIQKRIMFVAIGLALLLAGVMNITFGLGVHGGPVIFGFLQVFWGIKEMLKFNKYASIDKSQNLENQKKGELMMTGQDPFFSKTIQQGPRTYELYNGDDPEKAKAFLLKKEVNKPLYYIMVKTDQGTWGIDKEGLFLTNLLPWQNNLSLAQYEGAIVGAPNISNVGTAAKGVTDNFVVNVQCGKNRCEFVWIDALRYHNKTVVKCPKCKSYNLIDSNNLQYIEPS